MEPRPDIETQEWVRSVVGPFEVVHFFAHSHGYSKLWRLKTASDYVWLKMHAHDRKWSGEVHALTQWADPLSPDVLGWREQPATVLLTEMTGIHAEAIDFAPEAEERLWSEAGAWLKQFHRRTNHWFGEIRPDGSPGGRKTDSPSNLARTGFTDRIQQSRDWGLLEEHEVRWAESQFEEWVPSLDGATAHSIHRDYTPRNWLAEPDGQLTAVIDFEHARWDLRAADLNRPWDKEFLRNPRLVDAFYEAYGRPDELFNTQIQTLRFYNLVTGVAWAHQVGDAEFSEFNRRALRAWMRG